MWKQSARKHIAQYGLGFVLIGVGLWAACQAYSSEPPRIADTPQMITTQYHPSVRAFRARELRWQPNPSLRFQTIQNRDSFPGAWAEPPSRLKLDAKAAEFIKRWSKAYRETETLQYVSHYTYPPKKSGGPPKRVTIRFWMRRPNFLRAEVETGDPKEDSTLVSDGKIIWEYCPGTKLYAKTPMFDGPLLVMGELAGLTYVRPNMFFHPNPEQGITYGLASLKMQGVEKIEDENCLVVVRQYPQTATVTWCNENDYMPRYVVSYSLRGGKPAETSREERKDVRVNDAIPEHLFQFKPPKDAKLFVFPRPENQLLKPASPAPDFVAQDREGSEVRFSSLLGRPVLLMFWAAWCPTCQEEVPMLYKLQTEYANREVVALTVNSWDQPNGLQDYLARNPERDILFWQDPQSEQLTSIAYKQYGVRGIPTTYLIGADGKVIKAWIGYDDKKPAELRAALARLPQK